MFAFLIALIFRDMRKDLERQNQRRREVAREMLADYDRAARDRTDRQIAINKMIMKHK